MKFQFYAKNSLFGAVKITENADPDKNKYSGYGIGFDVRGTFSLPDGSGFGKNAIIFGADMNSSAHIDNRQRGILIHGKGTTQGLDDTTLTAEKQYATNFSKQQKKFCLSLHYNRANNYLFVNMLKSINSKQKILK